jgi:hypothetical protein
MKTFSNTLDGPDAKPRQITGQEFTNSIPSTKASSYQTRKLTLLVTLAITFAAFLMSACEDEPYYGNNIPPILPPTYPMVIRNMYPSAGAPGTTVAILGENFGTSELDNQVTFGPSYAEILYVSYGVINVRVPVDLPEGDYMINVSSNGQAADSPRAFTVIKDTVTP